MFSQSRDLGTGCAKPVGECDLAAEWGDDNSNMTVGIAVLSQRGDTSTTWRVTPARSPRSWRLTDVTS